MDPDKPFPDSAPRIGPEPGLANGSATPAEIQAAMDQLDRATFQWVRRVQRGEFGRQMSRDLGLDLEPAQFQGLAAIARVQRGHGGVACGRASVGAVAEELAIDPSRASRIAADLVAKGFVRRVASQSDGRQSILELSPGGDLVMSFVKQRKRSAFGRSFAGWSNEDIIAFSRLFTRFADAGFVAPEDDTDITAQRDAVASALAAELAGRSEQP